MVVFWLHCLLVSLLELVRFFWRTVCFSPQAELGPPGGVTYSCLVERRFLKMLECSLHCLRREEG